MKAKTGIDKLLGLLHDKKELTLGEAAEELGMDKDDVQQWVDFLVEKNRVMVHYKFMTPYITLLDPKGRSGEESTRETLKRIRQHQKKFSTAVKTSDVETAKAELESIEDEITNLDDPELKDDLYNEIIAYPERIRKIGGEAPEITRDTPSKDDETIRDTQTFKELFHKVKRLSQAGRIQEARKALMAVQQKADRANLAEHQRKQLKEKIQTAKHHIETVQQLQRRREAS